MFAARGIAVSLSLFLLVYGILSLAIVLAWPRLQMYRRKYSVRYLANGLYLLRMFPLLVAILITAAFTVPSFLLLEPRTIQEPIGEIPLALGLLGAALGLGGALNAVLAARRAAQTISIWTRESQPAEICSPVPVLRISRSLPPMTAAGIIHPRVLVSTTAEFLLTPNELHSALNHELAHIRRRDNLKKLLLRLVPFPGMSGLERAWLEAAEMAADDEAVSSTSQALDLAAALLKLSRLSSVELAPQLTAGLVHSPAFAMNARIERLVVWTEPMQGSQKYPVWYALTAIALAAAVAFSYSSLLVGVHEATELLVR